MMKVFKNAPPFIVWTLQRTGGTNLAKQLFERSGLLSSIAYAASKEGAPDWLSGIDSQWKLHEPFNLGDEERVFGKISEEWIATRNKKALEHAIGAICTKHVPVKHCVEMVPWEVSAALARMSSANGYRHLFLLRENSASRLLSLHFAKLSGVWGKHFLAKCELTEKIFSEPLPVPELVAHEASCIARLDRAWRLLHAHGAHPLPVRFEEIYGCADKDAGMKKILSILEYLGLSGKGKGKRKFAREVMESGEQGTRAEYGRFKGVPALEAALQTLKKPPFDPATYPLAVSSQCRELPQIVHAALDLHPEGVRPGIEFDVGGILVVEETLAGGAEIYALTEDGELPVQWGIPSPVVARKYANAANSAHARFKLNGIRCKSGAKVEFILRDGLGVALPLFLLHVDNNARSQ